MSKKKGPFKLDRKTGERLYLRLCQWKAIHFALMKKRVALFMDMGLGKTISVLSVIVALLHRQELKKPVLIVAPIRPMYTVWAQEAMEWSHTRKLTFCIVHGNERQRIQALDTPADIYLINPEGLRWLIRLLRAARANRMKLWPFGMLVIDESSMFKAPGSKRFRSLKHVLKFFQYRIILSGTPRPNSLMELWSQMFIVDRGRRLGTAYDRFKSRFFAPENEHVDYPQYVPRNGAEEYIHNLISDVAMSMEARDWLDFPPTIANPVYVDLPPRARALYDRFEEEMFLRMDRGDVDALTAAVVSMKCWQLANGSIYSIDRDNGEKIWEEVHQAKLEALEEIVEGTGSPVLVAYWFKPDLIRLRQCYPDAPVFGRQRNDTLEREWNDGKHPVVFAHYRSAAHGMNLQYGPGHTIACFSLTWSWELYDQLINRIGGARAQQRVTVHRIIARHTTDEAQIARLDSKQAGNRATLTALNQYRRQRVQEGNAADLI